MVTTLPSKMFGLSIANIVELAGSGDELRVNDVVTACVVV